MLVYIYFMDEPEFNIGDRWKWFIFRYNPADPDVITYKDTGWDTGKLSLNFAHKSAYLYLALLITCITLLCLMANGTIKV